MRRFAWKEILTFRVAFIFYAIALVLFFIAIISFLKEGRFDWSFWVLPGVVVILAIIVFIADKIVLLHCLDCGDTVYPSGGKCQNCGREVPLEFRLRQQTKGHQKN